MSKIPILERGGKERKGKERKGKGHFVHSRAIGVKCFLLGNAFVVMVGKKIPILERDGREGKEREGKDPDTTDKTIIPGTIQEVCSAYRMNFSVEIHKMVAFQWWNS